MSVYARRTCAATRISPQVQPLFPGQASSSACIIAVFVVSAVGRAPVECGAIPASSGYASALLSLEFHQTIRGAEGSPLDAVRLWRIEGWLLSEPGCSGKFKGGWRARAHGSFSAAVVSSLLR